MTYLPLHLVQFFGTGYVYNSALITSRKEALHNMTGLSKLHHLLVSSFLFTAQPKFLRAWNDCANV